MSNQNLCWELSVNWNFDIILDISIEVYGIIISQPVECDSLLTSFWSLCPKESVCRFYKQFFNDIIFLGSKSGTIGQLIGSGCPLEKKIIAGWSHHILCTRYQFFWKSNVQGRMHHKQSIACKIQKRVWDHSNKKPHNSFLFETGQTTRYVQFSKLLLQFI